ncbi:MAG: FlgD immunoglobulin-like domain containing protein [Candidatus Neomarinimicrobiota bacterium]
MRLGFPTAAFLLSLPFALECNDFETTAAFSNASLSKDEKGSIYLTIDSEEEISGLQFLLQYDESRLILGKPEISPNNQHFTIYTGVDSNILEVVAVSLEGKTLDLSEPVLMIPLEAAKEFESVEHLTVKEFEAASPSGTKINLRVSAGKIYVVPSLPSKFRLTQNFPNPFSSETIIRFDLPEDAVILLAIYDVSGEKVKELRSEIVPAGSYSVSWDGKDTEGRPLSSGAYFCSLKVGVNYHSIKMVLLR